MPRALKIVLLLGLTLIATAGCGRYPYRIDVPQGNIVTPKQLETLALGMTRNQVRFVLGTPMIADAFHADRWDYFYSLRRDDHIIASRQLTAVFRDDKLIEIRGDDIPAHLVAGASPIPPAHP